MGDKRATHRAYNGSYKPHPRCTDRFRCFYCGVRADTIDHVPPLSRISDNPDQERVKVPSCGECNKKLGSSLQANLLERMQHLRRVRQEDWSKKPLPAAEIKGYGPILGSKLKEENKSIKRNNARLEWLTDAIDYERGFV